VASGCFLFPQNPGLNPVRGFASLTVCLFNRPPAALPERFRLAPPGPPPASGVQQMNRSAVRVPWIFISPMNLSSAAPWWRWLILALAPFLAYWSTLTMDYGLRDDYALLREAREEPGKITWVCTSMGRPVFGWLEETSFRVAGDVSGLADLRLAGVALLAGLGLLTRAMLRRQGWGEMEALAAGLLMEFLPGAQVIASWATGWPYGVAALFGAAAFVCGEGIFSRTPLARPLWWREIGCVILLALAGLTYQCHALVYLVFVAAAWPAQTARPVRAWLRWLTHHALRVAAGLGLTFGVSHYIFWQWDMAPSARFGFTHDALGKVRWMFEQVLPDALNFFHLRNADAPWSPGFTLVLVLMLAFFACGALASARRHGWARTVLTLAGLAGLMMAASVVSLVARESFATYRTLLAASGVGAIGFCFAAREIAQVLAGRRSRLAGEDTRDFAAQATVALLAPAVATMLLLASYQCLHLFAIPQMEELMVMRLAVRDRHFAPNDRVFIVDPGAATRLGYLVFADEFGSLSTNSDWVPKEMFYQVLHERLEADAAAAADTPDSVAPETPAAASAEPTLAAGEITTPPTDATETLPSLDEREQEERPKRVAIGLQPPSTTQSYDFIIDLRLMWRLSEMDS